MNRLIIAAAAAALVAACLACEKDTTSQPAVSSPADSAANKQGEYRGQAQALVAALDGGEDGPAILKRADRLTALGVSMLPAMIDQHPECKAYLEAIVAVGPTLKDLPLEEIESGYHADGKLPKMPSGKCYHGKDLVVHPATVAALAKAGLATDKDRKQAKDEIAEVLGHLTAVE